MGSVSALRQQEGARHAVPGGGTRLRELFRSGIEVSRGDLFSLISGFVQPSMGGEVAAALKAFRDRVPNIHADATGVASNAYRGYELFFDAVVDQLLTGQVREKRLVNLLGIIPYQHLFWRGNLQVVKDLLERVGLTVNTVFTETDGLEALKRIPAAEANLVFSPWSGVAAARRLEERFATPYLVIPAVPVGPKDTSAFLRYLGRKLQLRRSRVESVIAEEEQRAYRFTEQAADIASVALSGALVGVVADAGTAVGLTRYGSNELGWAPGVVVVTDNPPEEYREAIMRDLTEGLASAVKPEVFFEVDSHKVQLILREYPLQLLFGSSLEKSLAVEELSALHVSVAVPACDRVVVDRTYAGYRGGVAFLEDVALKFGG